MMDVGMDAAKTSVVLMFCKKDEQNEDCQQSAENGVLRNGVNGAFHDFPLV